MIIQKEFQHCFLMVVHFHGKHNKDIVEDGWMDSD